MMCGEWHLGFLAFPVPVGAFDGCVFQNPLYGFKIAAADNRLMHIFCDVPLAPVYIVVMFIPEMLCKVSLFLILVSLNEKLKPN